MPDRPRPHFDAEELAVVLSHYELGVIESITEFARGSRLSPKVGIVAQRGKFLLKRRAETKSSPRRVQFSHAVQRHLSAQGFPLPKPAATRDGAHFVTRLGTSVYELFEFVSGQPYSGTVEETAAAGAALGRLHAALRNLAVPVDAPTSSYHDANGVRTTLAAIPGSVSGHDSVAGREAELMGLIATLHEGYDRASEAVTQFGFHALPVQVIHGDWHPGNMLFKHAAVAAVIDYDSCRYAPRVLDLANGVLQFSLVAAGPSDDWPDGPDESRVGAFLTGYRTATRESDQERQVLVPLMIESLVAEAVVPIAQTGRFGHRAGFRFLRMVARKARWLAENGDRLAAVMGG